MFCTFSYISSTVYALPLFITQVWNSHNLTDPWSITSSTSAALPTESSFVVIKFYKYTRHVILVNLYRCARLSTTEAPVPCLRLVLNEEHGNVVIKLWLTSLSSTHIFCETSALMLENIRKALNTYVAGRTQFKLIKYLETCCNSISLLLKSKIYLNICWLHIHTSNKTMGLLLKKLHNLL